LEKLAKKLEFKAGYVRVATPHITKGSLYEKTGHLPYYAATMYPPMELKEREEREGGVVEETVERYYLKPMNCPHHHRLFAARKRTYRELPLRLAEYGTVYRYEDSGALSGLLRVRMLSMNDAHIYCTEDQIQKEFLSVMDLHRELYEILGLRDYYMRFSTSDPDDPKGREKYVDDPPAWEKTETLVRNAMQESGLKFVEVKGEAAFYGPKIDVQFKTVTGREETASTNQLDFAIPPRLGLTYTGSDGQEHTPYVIHRAPLGTHERFVAFLIEHFGGAFPTWLAPVQVRFLTVSERFDEHARKLVAELRSHFVRAELDDSSDTVSKKVRNASHEKIPNVVVIGEREAAENTVTLRRLGVKEQESMPWGAFRERLLGAIAKRTTEL
jgi:threonyl-tRNA synthetase